MLKHDAAWCLQKRQVLEEAELLDPRISALEEDLDEVESSEEEEEEEEKVVDRWLTHLLHTPSLQEAWFLFGTFYKQMIA